MRFNKCLDILPAEAMTSLLLFTEEIGFHPGKKG